MGFNNFIYFYNLIYHAINIIFRTTFTYEQYFHRFTIPPYTFYEYNKTVSVKFSSSCGSRVHIVLKGKLYKFYKKLDDVEKEISVNYSIPFIRIHKSYLVNFQQIRKVGYTEVETKDGRILKISDTYKKDVRARYSKLLWDGDV